MRRPTGVLSLPLWVACAQVDGPSSRLSADFQPQISAGTAELRAGAVAATWSSDALRVALHGRNTGITLRTREASGAPGLGPCAITGARVGDDCHRRATRTAGDVDEWWHAEPRGLEHGFTVRRSEARVWRTTVDVDGAEATVTEAGVRLRGAEDLRYDQLVAWDATGAPLDAWFEAVDGGFGLAVDTHGARFPITVDPMLREADWTWFFPPNAAGLPASGIDVVLDVLGDTNGDGYDDAIYAARSFSADPAYRLGATFIFNGGPGGLDMAPSLELTDPDTGTILAWGDFNADGFVDLAIQGRNNGIDLHAGGPMGLTWTARIADATPTAQMMRAGDVNGDGADDLLLFTAGSRNRSAVAEVRLSAPGDWPTDTVHATLDVPNDLEIGQVAIADLDADGAEDLAVRHGDVVKVLSGALFNTPNPSLGDVPAPNARDAQIAWVGDVNGDGRQELAVGDPEYQDRYLDQGRVQGWQFAAGAPPTLAWTIVGDSAMRSVGTGIIRWPDADGDGDDELVLGASMGTSSPLATDLTLWEGGASPTFSSIAAPEALDLRHEWQGVATGDFNADGQVELLTRTFDPTLGVGFTVHPRTCSQEPTHDLQFFGAGLGAGLTTIAAGDVNGDGADDLLLDELLVWGGASTSTSPGPVWWQTVYVTDLDGDGDEDVLDGHGGLFLGGANPTFARADRQTGILASLFPDVDGDGATEIVGYTAAGWKLFPGRVGQLPDFASPTPLPRAPAWSASFATGDVNGDGRGDVVMEGARGVLTWLGRANRSFSAPLRTAGTEGMRIVGLTDLDDDGRDDLILQVQRRMDIAAFALRSAAAGFAPAQTILEGRADQIANFALIDDLDADGDRELVVGHAQALAAIDIHRGEPGGFGHEPAWILPGANAVLAADVNGDGRTDVVAGDPRYFHEYEYQGRVAVVLGTDTCGVGEEVWSE